MEVNRKRHFAEKHYGWRKKNTDKEDWLKQEIFGQKGENDEDWMRKNNKNKQEYGEKYLGKDKESDLMSSAKLF